MTSKLKYNPLLKLNLQEENEAEEITVDDTLDPDSTNPIANSAVANEFNTIIQRIDNYQDIDVNNLADFESAVALGATGSVRLHLRSDITLTSDVTYNLDNVQVYGHDNNINLQNHTFTVQGNTCYFYQVRFNANSNVSANSASNYSNACINLFGTSSSTRFFFEYVIFRNFLCKASDVSTNFFNVKCINGSYPSLHIYLMFCEVMTNYTLDNINSCTAIIYHSGSLNALTCHNVDFWGNKSEANSCPNWCYAGNNVVGAAKLGWISDGSCIYNQITGALTPNMVNQYNPSFAEFEDVANRIVMHPISQILADSENSNFNPNLCIYVCCDQVLNISNSININYKCNFVADDQNNYFNFNIDITGRSITFKKEVKFNQITFNYRVEFYFESFVTFAKCNFNCFLSRRGSIYDILNFYTSANIIDCNFFNNEDDITQTEFNIYCQDGLVKLINISKNNNFNYLSNNIRFQKFNNNSPLPCFLIDNTVNIVNDITNTFKFANELSVNNSFIVPNNLITQAINNLQTQINNFISITKILQQKTETDYFFNLEWQIVNVNYAIINFRVETRNTIAANTELGELQFLINNYTCVVTCIEALGSNIYHLIIKSNKIYNLEPLPGAGISFTGTISVILDNN